MKQSATFSGNTAKYTRSGCGQIQRKILAVRSVSVRCRVRYIVYVSLYFFLRATHCRTFDFIQLLKRKYENMCWYNLLCRPVYTLRHQVEEFNSGSPQCYPSRYVRMATLKPRIVVRQELFVVISPSLSSHNSHRVDLYPDTWSG